jgi:hypothetical protein
MSRENSAHPSLSCNARVDSGIDASKGEVTGIIPFVVQPPSPSPVSYVCRMMAPRLAGSC